MMTLRIFARGNVALLLLVLTTTIDASRLLYLPLLKLHPSHQPPRAFQVEKKLSTQYDTKLASKNRALPLAAIEHDKTDERKETEKRGNFDWNALVDKETAGRRIYSDNDLLPETLNEWDDSDVLDRNTRKSTNPPDSGSDTVNHLDDNQNGDEVWPVDTAVARAERLLDGTDERRKRRNDVFFIIIVGTCSLVGVIGLVAAAIFWYKIQKRAEAAVDAEYPSYGVTGPSSSGSKISPSSTMSDRKLAQSAQMFHYQQQRQQMMAQEKAHLDAKPVNSDDSDDEAPNGGDYTVYECPGLAPTGEMEVRNPLFAEPDPSLTSTASASHPAINNHYPQPLASTTSSSPPKEKSLP
jgi:hypothetical protein